MTTLQRFLVAIFPAAWARSMEEESRQWMVRCPCGNEVSVWDAGGVRWKAGGNPRRMMWCARCGKATWHRLYKRGSPDG